MTSTGLRSVRLELRLRRENTEGHQQHVDAACPFPHATRLGDDELRSPLQFVSGAFAANRRKRLEIVDRDIRSKMQFVALGTVQRVVDQLNHMQALEKPCRVSTGGAAALESPSQANGNRLFLVDYSNHSRGYCCGSRDLLSRSISTVSTITR